MIQKIFDRSALRKELGLALFNRVVCHPYDSHLAFGPATGVRRVITIINHLLLRKRRNVMVLHNGEPDRLKKKIVGIFGTNAGGERGETSDSVLLGRWNNPTFFILFIYCHNDISFTNLLDGPRIPSGTTLTSISQSQFIVNVENGFGIFSGGSII